MLSGSMLESGIGGCTMDSGPLVMAMVPRRAMVIREATDALTNVPPAIEIPGEFGLAGLRFKGGSTAGSITSITSSGKGASGSPAC